MLASPGSIFNSSCSFLLFILYKGFMLLPCCTASRPPSSICSGLLRWGISSSGRKLLVICCHFQLLLYSRKYYKCTVFHWQSCFWNLIFELQWSSHRNCYILTITIVFSGSYDVSGYFVCYLFLFSRTIYIRFLSVYMSSTYFQSCYICMHVYICLIPSGHDIKNKY